MTALFRLLFIAYSEDKDLLPYKHNDAYRNRSLKRKATELLELRTRSIPTGQPPTYAAGGASRSHPDEHADTSPTNGRGLSPLQRGHQEGAQVGRRALPRMSLPLKIEPTQTPNMTQLQFWSLVVFYSYQSPIAFLENKQVVALDAGKLSKMSGKHVGILEPDYNARLNSTEFHARLRAALISAAAELAKLSS